MITICQFYSDHTPAPVTRNSIELLSVALERLKALMNKLDGVDLFLKKLEMEEEEFVPRGLEEGQEEENDEESKSLFLQRHRWLAQENSSYV